MGNMNRRDFIRYSVVAPMAGLLSIVGDSGGSESKYEDDWSQIQWPGPDKDEPQKDLPDRVLSSCLFGNYAWFLFDNGKVWRFKREIGSQWQYLTQMPNRVDEIEVQYASGDAKYVVAGKGNLDIFEYPYPVDYLHFIDKEGKTFQPGTIMVSNFVRQNAY